MKTNLVDNQLKNTVLAKGWAPLNNTSLVSEKVNQNMTDIEKILVSKIEK